MLLRVLGLGFGLGWLESSTRRMIPRTARRVQPLGMPRGFSWSSQSLGGGGGETAGGGEAGQRRGKLWLRAGGPLANRTCGLALTKTSFFR